jgi:hypothetical protein
VADGMAFSIIVLYPQHCIFALCHYTYIQQRFSGITPISLPSGSVVSSIGRSKPPKREDPLIAPAYRRDIDGLRAIAIIAVVIYHSFPSLLPNGNIGVDIFFVISGI